MKCPACKQAAFETRALDRGLSSNHCTNCHGNWISGQQYWDWLREKGENLPETAPGDQAPQVADSTNAKTCPSCGRWLVRYKVGHGLAFSVEHCGGCDGVWLDAKEWDALKARNLHDDLQFICDSLWQKNVHKDEVSKLLETRFAKSLGPDFDKAREVRDWITNHPNRAVLLAFLVDHLPAR
jgi:Zn-finger nucleic acid-binding protein